MRSVLCFLVFPFALSALLPAAATTYTVLPDGTGDFPNIQAAIEAAADGDVIELGDGLFTGPGNHDIYFLGKAITVKSAADQADLCIIDCQGSAATPRRGFLFADGEGQDSVLRDVTVTNGYAPVSPYLERGGCIHVRFASPRFLRCVFRGGHAASSGGGVHVRNGDPVFVECTFTQNSAGMGGGLDTQIASVSLSSCVFENNQAVLGGGAALRDAGPYPLSLSSCVFIGNAAEQTGGGLVTGEGRAELFGCEFIGNTAATAGAARIESTEETAIKSCLFLDNEGFSGVGGLSQYVSPGTPVVLYGCTFARNRGGGDGGAVYLGSGGVSYTETYLESCTFHANEANRGSAVHCSGWVWAVFAYCLLGFSPVGMPVTGDQEAFAYVGCCDVFGNAYGDYVGIIEDYAGINGNICQDPWLCDPAADDFRLDENSPCRPYSPPNPECDLIGAHPVGCDITPAHQSSWGGIKSMFRPAAGE